MKFLIPLILGLLGVATGFGTGKFLRTEPPDSSGQTDIECAPPEKMGEISTPEATIDSEDLEGKEFVKLNNQFVVPVITNEKVASLVVVGVTIEIEVGKSELVYDREPKLRDLFLQVMFDQASFGRFSGDFTNSRNLEPLRRELRTVAIRVLGPTVSDVLITEIARQDA